MPAWLRRLVEERAGGKCEYCHILELDTFLGCEIEHILSEKHGGATTSENMAWACVLCNRHKGTDIALLSHQTDKVVRLFHPRTDHWQEHFKLRDDRIVGVSEVGEATARLLQFNSPERIMERKTLRTLGL